MGEAASNIPKSLVSSRLLGYATGVRHNRTACLRYIKGACQVSLVRRDLEVIIPPALVFLQDLYSFALTARPPPRIVLHVRAI